MLVDLLTCLALRFFRGWSRGSGADERLPSAGISGSWTVCPWPCLCPLFTSPTCVSPVSWSGDLNNMSTTNLNVPSLSFHVLLRSYEDLTNTLPNTQWNSSQGNTLYLCWSNVQNYNDILIGISSSTLTHAGSFLKNLLLHLLTFKSSPCLMLINIGRTGCYVLWCTISLVPQFANAYTGVYICICTYIWDRWTLRTKLCDRSDLWTFDTPVLLMVKIN